MYAQARQFKPHPGNDNFFLKTEFYIQKCNSPTVGQLHFHLVRGISELEDL